MRHLKLTRRMIAVALLLVGLLFHSRVHALAVITPTPPQDVVARMWPVFSYNDDDDDGDYDDDEGDDGYDDDGDD